MKIFWIILLVLVLILATSSLVNYLRQRAHQKRAEKDGQVVYATVVSVASMGGLYKHAGLKKVTLRLQDPGSNAPREVTLRTRIPAGQKIASGSKIAVMIDPKNPKLVYPATPEASKRAVITGSRLERRHLRMGAQGKQPQQPGGYQPPMKTYRR